MKKLISLLLVLVMLCTMTAAAFTDQAQINSKYTVAVTEMVNAGVINGMGDGTFQPQGTLTRAQAAKIICTMLEGADKVESITASASSFTDVPGSHWAARYIGYCADKNIVAGIGNGKFNPNGELTGAQWGKMLLAAYGHPAEELTGASWFANTQQAIKDKGLSTNAHISDSTTTREKACQLAYNFYYAYQVLGSLPYGETTISFAGGKNVKLLGRAEATDAGVVTNFPGDGVEFTLECAGNAVLNFKQEYAGNYQMFVDGEPTSVRAFTSSGTDVAAAYSIPAGNHTIRIIQDNDMSSSGKVNTLTSITLPADASTMKATAAKKLYVEFVGDSITAGVGAIGSDNSLESNSAAYAYSYQTALNLDADYSLICKGGLALAKLSSSTPKVFGKELYLAQNAYRDMNTKATYGKADVVVLALCTNDARDNAEFPAKLNELINEVKKLNPGCKVVVICNLMNDKYIDEIMAVNDPAKGIYSLKMEQNRQGGANHPTAEANARNAKTLADFIKTIV